MRRTAKDRTPEDYKKIEQMILQEVGPRVEGDCLKWLGYMYGYKFPVVYCLGPVFAVKWLFENTFSDLKDGEKLYRTCGMRRCVNPDHFVKIRKYDR